jgi:hypothetical protein
MKDLNKYQRPTFEQYEALKQNKRSIRQAGLFRLDARARLVTK